MVVPCQVGLWCICSPFIPSLTSNGTTTDSTRKKAECPNSVFASKSCVPNPSLAVPIFPSCIQLLLNAVSFAPEMGERFLEMLDSDSATGPDGNSSHVLKTCSADFAPPLSTFFTLSFARDHLPCDLKSANITALHKKMQKRMPLTTDQLTYFLSPASS